MDTITPSQQERAEMELVLQSGIFLKSPRLARFFRYVCERHLEGRADQLKEYSIALEALGRPAEFDPKKDSIVRVEAHRLRKRLEEYYNGPGANHPIQITIPNGQYRPCFLIKDLQISTLAVFSPTTGDGEAPTPSPSALGTLEEFDPVISHPPSQARDVAPWKSGIAIAFVCLAVAVALWTLAFRGAKASPKPAANEIWMGSYSDPVESEFRMSAGYHDLAFVDHQGHSWEPDAYYKGGVSIPLLRGRLIEGASGANCFKAERSGSFQYNIPLRQGTYELHLYFAETEYGRSNPKGGSDGSRTFQVSANGQVILPEFDALGEAGAANRLHERVFKDISPASDGKLHLAFEPLTGPAFLNALALLPGSPGRVHPLRIVTQSSPVTDSDGRVWAADEYYSGGTSVSRRNVVLDGKEKTLFQGERYGNFIYHLPAPPGKYRLTLRFAETYFGLPGSARSAVDARIFNVFVNGEALLRNFQIVREAGGPNRTVTKTFNNLEPNAQGVLALEFVPVRNYAEVNAIEVVQAN